MCSTLESHRGVAAGAAAGWSLKDV